jgi:hypothetical protein
VASLVVTTNRRQLVPSSSLQIRVRVPALSLSPTWSALPITSEYGQPVRCVIVPVSPDMCTPRRCVRYPPPPAHAHVHTRTPHAHPNTATRSIPPPRRVHVASQHRHGPAHFWQQTMLLQAENSAGHAVRVPAAPVDASGVPRCEDAERCPQKTYGTREKHEAAHPEVSTPWASDWQFAVGIKGKLQLS